MIIRNIQPVQEAYFGKSPNLLKAEKIIASFNLKKSNTFSSDNIKQTQKMFEKSVFLNKFRKLEECFEKEFGFRKVTIRYLPAVSGSRISEGSNAFTFTCRSIIFPILSDSDAFTDLPHTQKDGKYYDKNHANDCTIILTGDIINIGFTPSEFVAFILHEIGHNFQFTPLTIMSKLLPIIELITMTPIFGSFVAFIYLLRNEFIQAATNPIVSGFFDTIKKTSKDLFKPNTNTMNLILFIVKFRNLIKKTYNSFKILENFKWIFNNGFNKIINANPWEIARTTTGYSGEVFADSFATAYGYGADLSSGLLKLGVAGDQEDLYQNESNPLDIVAKNTLFVCFFAYSFIDVHPDNITRLRNQIDKLEDELKNNKDLPKPLAAKVKEDLNKCKKIYKEYLDIDKNEDKQLLLSYYIDIINSFFADRKLVFRNELNKLLNLGFYRA